VNTNTQTIRSLNDRFRQAIPSAIDVQGRVVMTQGIQALCDTEAEPALYLGDLLKLIREFDDFETYNDPYGEHDFGAFDFRGEKCFWKIDYYAPDLQSGSEDPSDATKTMRILTVMLASEY
jgi:hypothetical protein